MKALTMHEWLERCIAHFIRRGVDLESAKNEAEAWLESNPGDIEDSPEEVAEDIMSYWTAD